MNLNRNQFVKAVERGEALLKELKKDYPELGLKPVFSRFGARSGQCDLITDLRKIVVEFPEMLVDSNNTRQLRGLLFDLKKAVKANDKEAATNLRKQCDALEEKLLAPELLLYCGDVLIEYRPGELHYKSLNRLQQDSRLPPGLNTTDNIRVIAGSLEFLSKEVSNVAND